MKGTTVKFKAFKEPPDAPWPNGKPVWGGTAGATGTGETKDVTFNATGDKTVTAECGNTVTLNVKVYELTGVHIAQDNFTGRATTKYGAAEVADLSFTVNPAGITAAQMGGLSWSVAAGDGTVANSGTSGTGTYTAHWTNSTVTLRLTVQTGPSKGKFVDAGLTVVKPSDMNLIQKPASGIWHVQGVCSVGFKGWAYMLPKDVSFTNVDFSEGACNATLNGWFAAQYPLGLPHLAGTSVSVADGNSTTGCKIEADDTVSSQNFPPPAWAAGWFTWPIPWRYSVGGGGWTTITTATHRVDIDAAAKLTIQKKGVGPFTKNINDANSNY